MFRESLFLWRITKSQQPHRVRDWSGILLETEAGDGGGSEGEKRYSGKPDGVAGTPKKIGERLKTKG